RGKTVLKNPTIQQLADCLGLNPTLDRTQIWDVVIIGAGPAGLGAAVYAASEGLNAVIIEANAPGGQAGTSSRIENYLGFPLGISGQELASRAYDQAQKFGARVLIAKRAMRLGCDRKPFRVLLDGGDGDALLGHDVPVLDQPHQCAAPQPAAYPDRDCRPRGKGASRARVLANGAGWTR